MSIERNTWTEADERAWQLEMRRQRQASKSTGSRLHEANELTRAELQRQGALKAAAEAEHKPAIETYQLVVQKRTRADGRQQWRLEMRHGSRKVIQTPWRPRRQFLAELAQHQTETWAQWVLQGTGRPIL